jgi:membrane protease YdiL (CAAX protease family)
VVALITFGLAIVLSLPVFLLVSDPGMRLVLSVSAGVISLAAATLGWVAAFHKGAFAALGLRSRSPARDLLAGVLTGFACYPVIAIVIGLAWFFLLSLILGRPVDPPEQQIIPPRPDELEAVIGGVSAIVLAPIGEELFFRGFLFGALRSRFRFAVAAVISAVPFALVHDFLFSPLLFVFGIVLALLYERRGTLLSSIGAHAAFNVVGYSFLLIQA